MSFGIHPFILTLKYCIFTDTEQWVTSETYFRDAISSTAVYLTNLKIVIILKVLFRVINAYLNLIMCNLKRD
jgi:hypothetical protein